jgi:aminoglycoside 6'-N-acetyltransferase
MLQLRPMNGEDLTLVGHWLGQPHVARWWDLTDSVDDELDKYRRRLAPGSRIRMLTILELRADGATPVGWCQWYPYDEHPEEAVQVGARPGECGIDYAIGDRSATGRGLGSELIPALVAEVRRCHPGCGVIVDPDAANTASRRVLERAGFQFVELRPWPDGSGSGEMATYRLPATAVTAP